MEDLRPGDDGASEIRGTILEERREPSHLAWRIFNVFPEKDLKGIETGSLGGILFVLKSYF